MLVTLNAGNAILPGMALLSTGYVSAYWGKVAQPRFWFAEAGAWG